MDRWIRGDGADPIHPTAALDSRLREGPPGRVAAEIRLIRSYEQALEHFAGSTY